MGSTVDFIRYAYKISPFEKLSPSSVIFARQRARSVVPVTHNDESGETSMLRIAFPRASCVFSFPSNFSSYPLPTALIRRKYPIPCRSQQRTRCLFVKGKSCTLLTGLEHLYVEM